MFQPGFTFSPPSINKSETGVSPPPSSKENIDDGSKVASNHFIYSSKPAVNHTHRKSRTGAISGALCGVVFVASLVVLFIIHLRKSQKANVDCTSKNSLPITLPAAQAVNLDHFSNWNAPIANLGIQSSHYKWISYSQRTKRYSAVEILSATNNFGEQNLLGEGPNGYVYRTEFPDSKILVAKAVRMIPLAVYEEEAFETVVSEVIRLKHPNIADLYGNCAEPDHHVLVYEYARNGSLNDFLSSDDESGKVLSWKYRVKIALGVAHALKYMHCTLSPHQNIKATNILLDDEFIPHICDGGLTDLQHLIEIKPKAFDLSEDTNGYAAPELGIGEKDKTKCDVYSFGVLLLVLLTGRRASDSSRREEEKHLVRWASLHLHDFSWLEGMVDPEIRGSFSSRELSRLADIISQCIQLEPEFRSPMSTVVENLIQFVEMKDYGGPELSNVEASDHSFKSMISDL